MMNYLRSFNAKDVESWSKTMQFPHIRIASGEIVCIRQRPILRQKSICTNLLRKTTGGEASGKRLMSFRPVLKGST